ncbi:helix-turn-helix domain-containing protein [Campylobacter coli]
MNKKAIGERIKLIRLEKGLTLEEFGKFFNAGKGTVSTWENGKCLPVPKRLKKLAEISGKSMKYILEGK